MKFRNDMEDLTGKQFYRLTALSPIRKKGRLYWTCVCECETTKDIRADSLKSGTIRSCGCLNKETQKAKTTKYGESHMHLVYHYYKKSAKDRNLSFNITEQQLKEIVVQDCIYCGKKPSLSTTPYIRENLNGYILCNGADRIDSSKGYSIDNIVPCCSKCNQIKMDMSVEDFFQKVEDIYLNMANAKESIDLLKIGLGGYVIGRSVEKSVKAYKGNK